MTDLVGTPEQPQVGIADLQAPEAPAADEAVATHEPIDSTTELREELEHALPAGHAEEVVVDTTEATVNDEPTSAEYTSQFNEAHKLWSETSSLDPEYVNRLTKVNELLTRAGIAKLREDLAVKPAPEAPAEAPAPELITEVPGIVKRGEVAAPAAPAAPMIEAVPGVDPKEESLLRVHDTATSYATEIAQQGAMADAAARTIPETPRRNIPFETITTAGDPDSMIQPMPETPEIEELQPSSPQ